MLHSTEQETVQEKIGGGIPFSRHLLKNFFEGVRIRAKKVKNSEWTTFVFGLIKRMMDGTYKTASTPFGYDYVDGELQINPEKAKIVKQIFSWYVGGIGMNEIAMRLNSQNVREEVWRHGTIRCILTNEKYIGDE